MAMLNNQRVLYFFHSTQDAFLTRPHWQTEPCRNVPQHRETPLHPVEPKNKMMIFRSNTRIAIFFSDDVFLCFLNIEIWYTLYVCVYIYMYGMVWYGMAWCGVVWYGMVWCVSYKSSKWDLFHIATTLVFRAPPFWPEWGPPQNLVNQAQMCQSPSGSLKRRRSGPMIFFKGQSCWTEFLQVPFFNFFLVVITIAYHKSPLNHH